MESMRTRQAERFTYYNTSTSLIHQRIKQEEYRLIWTGDPVTVQIYMKKLSQTSHSYLHC